MSPPQPDAGLPADSEYTEPLEEDDEPPASPPARPKRAREGLPAAYRMRHASHYVEHLMGDTPLQTVRQISIDHIDRVSDAAAAVEDVADLADSIRQVGMLQPLLVTQGRDARFALLAGDKRLVAAEQAGLKAVPCLVVQAEQDRLTELRTQAAVVAVRREPEAVTPASEPQHAAVVPADEVHAVGLDQLDREVTVAPGASAESDIVKPGGQNASELRVQADASLTATVAEIGGALEFVAALLPATAVARTPFQQAIVADIVAVERRRGAALTAAAAALANPAALQVEEFDWLPFTESLRTEAGLEARLRSVELEWLHSLKLRPAVADKTVTTTAWAAIFHAVLGVSTPGDRLEVTLSTPRLRPAILLTVALHSPGRFAAAESSSDGAGMLSGGPGELLLSSARQGARRQGGRVTVSSTADALTVEFVAPQPLAYWQ